MSNPIDPLFDDFAALSEEESSAEEMDTALDELEADLQGIEMVPFDVSEFGLAGLESLSPEQQAEMEFFGRWIREKVSKYLRKLVALLRRYGPRLARCVPAVRRAVALARSGKWVAALRAAYQAYRCIRSALS